MKKNDHNILTLLVLIIITPITLANGVGNPFFKHIIEGHTGEVALYLEGDNSPDLRDSHGHPALILATTYNQPQIIQLLLEAQANPNLTDNKGMTALMVAAQQKYLDIIPILLQWGAHINQQNSQNGYTALMYAVQKNFIAGVKLLLEQGAQINLRNHLGENALAIAQERDYQEIIQLLFTDQWAIHDNKKTVTLPAHAGISEYIGKANYLLAQDHLDLAREVLQTGYHKTGQIELLQKWLEVDERLFNQLKIRNQKRTLTQRNPDEFFEQSWNFWSNRNTQIKYEQDNPIATLPLSTVNQTLEEYEQLKFSLIAFGDVLRQKIREAASRELEEYEILLTRYKALIEDAKKTRYRYISFDVLSPYLGRADQLVFLSEHAYLFSFSHSPDILQAAAKMLAKSTHQDLIFEADSSIQEQFFNVYQFFKSTAGVPIPFKQWPLIQELHDHLRRKNQTQADTWWRL